MPSLLISSQLIGEPETGLWCSVCQEASAVLCDFVLLVTPEGTPLYEASIAKLTRVWSCEECGGSFEMPDEPTLHV